MAGRGFELVCLVVLLSSVYGDIYLHNPRGSNNRQNENTRPRTNANRIFDSQNNNRGGYNVGEPMKFYAGSKLQIEWTNQHSCSAKNSHCELVLQYMCDNNAKDGTTTGTIPINKNLCANTNCDTDPKFGRHESYNHYKRCLLRERNKGLFTADQNMANRETAVSTRQENNGKNNRYGYECTEERDYYPYWHSSPWKDIAVLTNDPSRCQYYHQESANVKSRWECNFSPVQLEKLTGKVLPNNEKDCLNFNENGQKGEWKEIAAHGLPAPECRETQFSRDNHLGNGLDGQPNRYNWTLPDIDETNCVLRIRYNISTKEYNGWSINHTLNANEAGKETKIDLSKTYGFQSMSDAKQRGYVYKGDPAVKIFNEGGLDYQLAVDTSQFGRTFQDRTHVFSVKKRPSNLKEATIHNVNVRGKRGNIVQVYPAVEYDFVPNTLEIPPDHYVHFQWTGSDNNPANNDGQGQAKTDRNNVLLLKNKNYPEGNGVQYGPAPTYGHYGNNYPMQIEDSTFLGLSNSALTKLAFSSDGEVDANLNNAAAYFDLGPKKVTKVGTYHYVSTRNNNFSNRDQKGRIIVNPEPFREITFGANGGEIILPTSSGSLKADAGVLTGLKMIRTEIWPVAVGEQKVKAAGKEVTVGEEFASDFLVVYPQERLTKQGRSISASLKLNTAEDKNIAVFRTNSDWGYNMWTKMDTKVAGQFAKFPMTDGGVYIARTQSSMTVYYVVGALVGILIIALIVGTIVFFCRKRQI